MTGITPTPSPRHGTDREARMGRGDWRHVASGDGKWRSGHTATRSITAGKGKFSEVLKERPRHDSNVRTRLRRPLLYPLSYGGWRIPRSRAALLAGASVSGARIAGHAADLRAGFSRSR